MLQKEVTKIVEQVEDSYQKGQSHLVMVGRGAHVHQASKHPHRQKALWISESSNVWYSQGLHHRYLQRIARRSQMERRFPTRLFDYSQAMKQALTRRRPRFLVPFSRCRYRRPSLQRITIFRTLLKMRK